MILWRTAVALVLFLVAADIRGALEFTGCLIAPDQSRFIVTDLESGRSSAWLAIGQSFQGHKLTSFDAKAEVLTVERDGSAVRLLLKTARVRDGKATVPTEKTEVSIAIGADGTLSMNGRPLAFETLNLMLQNEAKAGKSVALLLHQPPNPNEKVHEANKRMLPLLQAAGVKKASVRIIDAPAPK